MYKRLTERDEFGNADIIGLSTEKLFSELCFDEINLLTKALNKLAFLETKIENGTLIEFPRIDRYVDYCYGLEKFVVQWVVNGKVKSKTFWNEKKAEKKLKELKNERF